MGVPGVGAVGVGAVDVEVLAAWASRLAATEVQLHELASGLRRAAAGTPGAGPAADALTDLVDRTVGEIAALAQRVGRAARLLAAGTVR